MYPPGFAVYITLGPTTSTIDAPPTVMNLTEILMIATTALSPVIAVQVTRFLDDRKEEQGRRLQVFKTLMATRAYGLSTAHVEALNRIDLEFSGNLKSD